MTTLRAVMALIGCLFANIRAYIAGEASVGFCERSELEVMARERYQAKEREALAEYVRTLDLGQAQKATLRHDRRQVICGWCGAVGSIFDTCPRCRGKDGSAVPLPHPPTIERLRAARVSAERSYRRAEARRKRAVLRPLRTQWTDGASPTAPANRKEGAMTKD